MGQEGPTGWLPVTPTAFHYLIIRRTINFTLITESACKFDGVSVGLGLFALVFIDRGARLSTLKMRLLKCNAIFIGFLIHTFQRKLIYLSHVDVNAF